MALATDLCPARQVELRLGIPRGADLMVTVARGAYGDADLAVFAGKGVLLTVHARLEGADDPLAGVAPHAERGDVVGGHGRSGVGDHADLVRAVALHAGGAWVVRALGRGLVDEPLGVGGLGPGLERLIVTVATGLDGREAPGALPLHDRRLKRSVLRASLL